MERFEGLSPALPDPRDPALLGSISVSRSLATRWFEALYHSPVVFSGLLDEQGRVIAANRLSIEGNGLSRDQIVGAPIWEGGWWSPDPDLAASLRARCEQVVSTRRPFRTISRYFRGDGSTGMVDLSLVPIEDEPQGHPDEAAADHRQVFVVVTGIDLSDLLADSASREDRLAEDTRLSRVAEERFRGALDAMLDDVIIAESVRDEQGTIVDFEVAYVNRARAAATAGAGIDIVGRRVCDLYPGWRTSGMFDRFVGVVESGTPYVGERLPYDDVRKDGHPISGYWDLRIARLDDGYIAASRDVTRAVRDEEALRAARALAERERLVVEVLQRAALPAEIPAIAGLDIGVHHQPAHTLSPIGGDWYDVLVVGGDKVVLTIADVAGHGPDTATYTVQVRNILRTIASEGELDAATMLERANQVIWSLQEQRAPFITCCLAILDVGAGVVQWALAGHPPPVIVAADGRAHPSAEPGPPLGMAADVAHRSVHSEVGPGDRIVLYTDGLVERRGSTIDDDIDRLRDAVARSSHLDAASTAPWLVSELSPGFDDIALLVVDVTS